MKKNLLHLTLSEILQVYQQQYPGITQMAKNSETPEKFKYLLNKYIQQLITGQAVSFQHKSKPDRHPSYPAVQRIFQMFLTEGQMLYDFARDKEFKCESVTLLWQALRTGKAGITTDFLLEWYYLFKQLQLPRLPSHPAGKTGQEAARWPTGTTPRIVDELKANRIFMINLLVEKIECRKNKNTRYHFTEDMDLSAKQEQVNKWWYDFQFQLTMAIRDPHELNRFLAMTLSPETMHILCEAEQKGIPFFITPYYLSLLSTKPGGYDDAAVRSYILYSQELVSHFGKIRAWEKEDTVTPGEPNAAGWLLPNQHSIHRRYPEVAIFIPDSMGRACGGLCAVCQRMYGFQQGRLNFNFEQLKPRENWEKQLQELMNYFENDSQLRDILITGGDALMSSNKSIRKILDAILRMALRKKEANLHREEGEKYAEIQRIRLGSRLLAYLPCRIDSELADILQKFCIEARAAGIRQFFIQTHFQSPLEVTNEVINAVHQLQQAGWLVTNQQVFTVAASRRGHSAALRHTLNQAGILPYYTFSVKGFEENHALAVPNCRHLQEMAEEKAAGRLPKEYQHLLAELSATPQNMQTTIPRLLKNNRLPFLATDRNVMNLPGIGKSLSFKTVGITYSGQRILRFNFDPGRTHSPITGTIKKIYIIENKSVAAYLRQLEAMGEKTEEYDSIWYYNESTTEKTTEIFQYPQQTLGITKRFTNYKESHI